LTLHDVYHAPEEQLQKTNNYQRNFMLFRKILPQNTSSLEVSFKICTACGLIFFSPRPDDNDLGVKYSEIASSRETENREEAFRLVDLRKRRAREIAQRILPIMKETIGAALDIGGADGHCLDQFTATAACSVLDFEKREMWPGVKRIGATLDDIDDGQKFDLILCCHTLEHIDRLRAFLGDIRKHLYPGGLLYIEVPFGCNGEIFQTRNVLTHLNFFSVASMRALLEPSGFDIEDCRAAPVLSRKRYLPVVFVVARMRAASQRGMESGSYYESTMSEMRARAIDWRVVLCNIILVLSQPVNSMRSRSCGREQSSISGRIVGSFSS
jgi:SAM-dependent methyltransferase